MKSILSHKFHALAFGASLVVMSCGQAPANSESSAASVSLAGLAVTAVSADAAVSVASEPTCRGNTPVLLVPGFLAFQTSFGLNYFQGVVNDLRQQGWCVDVARLPGIAPVWERAEILRAEVRRFRAQIGSSKMHLVAHSQGGLDARWMLSHLGGAEDVASLTTIATPHQGTPVADAALVADSVMIAPWRALFGVSEDTSGTGLKALAPTLKSLSVAWVTNVMNPTTPDVEGVVYRSYSAQAAVPPLGWEPIHPLMSVTATYLTLAVGANDGLVPLASMSWGSYRGQVYADHMSQVGHGLYVPFLRHFDHLKFYRDVVSGLSDLD